MRKVSLFLVILFFSLMSAAQSSVTDSLKKLIDEEKYMEAIARYADTTRDYPAKAYFYIALAYYYRNEDEACIAYIDRSIAKDSSDPVAYSVKGSTLNYMKRYSEAIPAFRKAIALDSSDGRFLYGLGNSQFSLGQYDSALVILQLASIKEKTPADVFSMIGEIYSIRKQYDKAEQAFLSMKERMDSTSEAYPDVLHNVGLMQLLAGNYEKAEQTYNGILNAYPTYYYSYPKLIQIHYHHKNYDKAKPFKDVLYKAKSENKLPESLQDMFCIDQFQWNDRLIQVYERYEEGKSNRIYYKHMFYVINDSGNIDYRIQTEYSPSTLAISKGKTAFLLGMSQGPVHSTFNYGFTTNYSYDAVKEAVIAVLDKKVTPASSSRPGNK